MRKYEEEHYRFEHIKDKIYPWIVRDLKDVKAINKGMLSEKDTALLQFDEELKVAFAIKRGEEIYEILQDAMLPPQTDVLCVYQKACENLAKDIEFVISNTMYGAFGILADGMHEASAICLQSIWQTCADKLEDDLLIAVPAKDAVLFARMNDTQAVKTMIQHAKGEYDRGVGTLTLQLYRYRKDEKLFEKYEGV